MLAIGMRYIKVVMEKQIRIEVMEKQISLQERYNNLIGDVTYRYMNECNA